MVLIMLLLLVTDWKNCVRWTVHWIVVLFHAMSPFHSYFQWFYYFDRLWMIAILTSCWCLFRIHTSFICLCYLLSITLFWYDVTRIEHPVKIELMTNGPACRPLHHDEVSLNTKCILVLTHRYEATNEDQTHYSIVIDG